MSLKQRKIKFEPRIKLNHNIYIWIRMDGEKIGYGVSARLLDEFGAKIGRNTGFNLRYSYSYNIILRPCPHYAG